MADFRPACKPLLEAEIAIGSLLGIPPASIRDSVVVAVDDAGKVYVGGPAMGSPDAAERLAGLLADACTVLAGTVPS